MVYPDTEPQQQYASLSFHSHSIIKQVTDKEIYNIGIVCRYTDTNPSNAPIIQVSLSTSRKLAENNDKYSVV